MLVDHVKFTLIAIEFSVQLLLSEKLNAMY